MADELRILRIDDFTDVVDGVRVEQTRVEWRYGSTDGPFVDRFPRGTTGADIRRALEDRVRELQRIRGEF